MYNAMKEITLPNHVGIIMDGNGRWAEKRNLDRTIGHKNGLNSIEETLECASDLGVKYITLYAFSTENWKRPKKEIEFIFSLPRIYYDRLMKTFTKKKIKVIWIGQKNKIDFATYSLIKKIEKNTSKNTRMILYLAFNYGGRAEIIEATKNIYKDIQKRKIEIKQIDEKLFSNYINTPDLDLLIRTSGEYRVSNFLLWQISYAEMYFTKKMWPDFKKEDFLKAIKYYQSRNIRKGSI